MHLEICARCGKLAKIFSHYGRCKDLPMCYVCYYREYRQRNKEKFRGYYRKNRPKILARQRARRREQKRLKLEAEQAKQEASQKETVEGK